MSAPEPSENPRQHETQETSLRLPGLPHSSFRRTGDGWVCFQPDHTRLDSLGPGLSAALDELLTERELGDRLAAELARWGWGDMHYGEQPQERGPADLVAEHAARRGTPPSRPDTRTWGTVPARRLVEAEDERDRLRDEVEMMRPLFELGKRVVATPLPVNGKDRLVSLLGFLEGLGLEIVNEDDDAVSEPSEAS